MESEPNQQAKQARQDSEHLSENLSKLESAFTSDLENAETPQQITALQAGYLGKRSQLRGMLQSVKDLPQDLRMEYGQKYNLLKQKISKKLAEKEQNSSHQSTQASLDDISLPGRRPPQGSLHPLTIIRNEALRFFNRRGFVTVWGNELESEYYNFEALNIPKNHPARDEHDSYYLQGKSSLLLRSQTSNMQIRAGEQSSPPLAIVSPGRVFRRDTLDATHSYTFHQIEGMYINRGVSFADLKGLLIAFCRHIFGDAVKVRFRPDYFPFTEPSCEIAIEYSGKSDGWLELLGAGLMNPFVLKNMGIDPNSYSGYAFGLGLERIAMLSYGIKDIRIFYENDEDFLMQFN